MGANVRRGGILPRRCAVVRRAHARQRQQRDPCAAQRLAVLHAQNVVGVRQHRRVRADQFFRRTLPCRCKGIPLVKLGFEGFRERIRGQRVRDVREGVRVRALAAERERVHDARRRQHLHPALCKALGGGDRPRQRQLQHQIGSSAHRRFGADMLAENGKISPLREVPAHNAHDPHCAQPPQLRKLPRVSGVKRIVFADNSSNLHKNLCLFLACVYSLILL